MGPVRALDLTEQRLDISFRVHVVQRDQVLNVLKAQRWCGDLLLSRKAKRPLGQLGGNTSACCFCAVYTTTPGGHMCPEP